MNLIDSYQSHIDPLYTALSSVAIVFALGKFIFSAARAQAGDLNHILQSIVWCGILFISITQFRDWIGLVQDIAHGLADLVNADPSANHQEFARVVTNGLEGEEDVSGWDVLRDGGLTKLVTYWIVLFLGIIAMGIVWLAELVQGIAILFGIGLAPLMLSLIILDSTRGIGIRYVISMVALALIPVAWAVMDIGTSIILEWAADDSDGPTTLLKNLGAIVTLTFYLIIATIVAPIAFYRQLTSGSFIGMSMIQGALSSMGAGASYGLGAGTAVHSAGGSHAATGAASAAAGAGGLASGALGSGGMLVPAAIGSMAIMATTRAANASSPSESTPSINQQANNMAAKYKPSQS